MKSLLSPTAFNLTQQSATGYGCQLQPSSPQVQHLMKLRNVKYLHNIVSKTKLANSGKTIISWSSDGRVLAVYSSNTVYLFDNQGKRRDKFATKPSSSNTTNTSYNATCMAFSDDSSRLAIAQNDGSVYVYKLGNSWDEKKAICNKFLMPGDMSVTCLDWLSCDLIIFGLNNGQIIEGDLRTNEWRLFFTCDSPVLRIACNANGDDVVYSGVDNSVHLINQNRQNFKTTSTVIQPRRTTENIILWSGGSIVAVDSSNIIIYQTNGAVEQKFDVPFEKGESIIGYSIPSRYGAASIGSSKRLFIVTHDKEWRLAILAIDQDIESFSWNHQDNLMAVATNGGDIIWYSVNLKSILLKQQLEIVVSFDCIDVTSFYGQCDTRIRASGIHLTKWWNIYQSCFIIGSDEKQTTFIIDLGSGNYSQFHLGLKCSDLIKCEFSYFPFGLLLLSSEVIVITLGKSEQLLRWSFQNDYQFDLVHMKYAMLIDTMTLIVHNFFDQQTRTISHNKPIVWFRLSRSSESIIFKDETCDLFKYDLLHQTKILTLAGCTFSCIMDQGPIIAQKDHTLYMWQSPDLHDDMKIQIEGIVENVNMIRENEYEIILKQGSKIVRQTLHYVSKSVLQDGHETKDDENFCLQEYLPLWISCYTKCQIQKRCFTRILEILVSSVMTRFSATNVDAINFVLDEMNTKNKKAVSMNKVEQQINFAKVCLQENRYREAIEKFASVGFIGRALRILETLPNDQKKMDCGILIQRYRSVGLFEGVGYVHELVEEYEHAIDAYKTAGNFERAVALAKTHHPQTLPQLNKDIEEYVLNHSLNAMFNCIPLTIENTDRLVQFLINSNQWRKVTTLVNEVADPRLLQSYWRILAIHFEQQGELSLTKLFYGYLKDYQTMLRVYVNHGLWDDVYKFASLVMKPEHVTRAMTDIGKEIEQQGLLSDAEELYICLGLIDDAIAMYLRNHMYSDAIRITALYKQERRTEVLDYIANELMDSGFYSASETYFVEAGKWKKAAEMYSERGLYENAYNVIKLHGDSFQINGMVFSWISMLEGAPRIRLLQKLGCLESIISYALDSKYFDVAIDICTGASPDIRRGVHIKHGHYFEQQGMFQQAEESYLNGQAPHEVLRMYIEAAIWDKAEHFEQLYFPGKLVDVLTATAQKLCETQDFSQMEKFVLQAQYPEIALDYYKKTGMWKDALRFTRNYVPGLLPVVELEYERSMSGTKGVEQDITDKGKILEQKGKYVDAIQLYASADHETIDKKKAEYFWKKAVDLTLQFQPELSESILTLIASRFSDAKEFEQAGQLYLKLKDNRRAVISFASGYNWEEARLAARNDPQLQDIIDHEYIKYLRAQGHYDELGTVDIVAALDLLVQHEDWDRCVEKAFASQQPDIFNRYAVAFIASLLQENNFLKPLQLYHKYGVPLTTVGLSQLEQVGTKILQAGDHIFKLNEVLMKYCANSSMNNIQRLLMASHLYLLRDKCQQKDMLELVEMQSTALLRYTDFIKPDMAFYQAGLHAKKGNHEDIAFVYWNHFLDICDAIVEQKSSSTLSYQDLNGTDIPKLVVLPLTLDLVDERDQVNEWILATSLKQGISHELPTRKCQKCQTEINVASLECHTCSTLFEPCIVTGYPLSTNYTRCTSCKQKAERTHWNIYVARERCCPWCNTLQNPVY